MLYQIYCFMSYQIYCLMFFSSVYCGVVVVIMIMMMIIIIIIISIRFTVLCSLARCIAKLS